MSKADDDVKVVTAENVEPGEAVDLENREDSEDVDFSKLKKKKKKSKPLPAELDDRPTAEGAAAGAMDAAAAAAAAVPPKGEQMEDLDAIFGEKKKKKKKVTIEGVDDGAASPAEAAEGEFDGLKKKKSGKKKSTMAEFEEALKDEEDEFGASGITFAEGDDDHEGGAEGKEPWLGSDRDYLYKELLNRVFQNLRQFNPDLVGEKKKYTMTPPSIHREPKKTIFANLVDICRKMHRQPEHLIQFLFAELGTTGSTDGEQRLVIKGRFTPKQIEAIIRRYIMDYVQCKTCKSPDTILVKENRLFFLQCESCNSTRSVAAIKSGFKALTEKRAVQRRAAAG